MKTRIALASSIALLSVLYSTNALSLPPPSEVYLHCQTHIFHIKRSLSQRWRDNFEENYRKGERIYELNFAVEILDLKRKASFPKFEEGNSGFASVRKYSLTSRGFYSSRRYTIDRVAGELIGSNGRFRCTSVSKNRIQEIISRHNFRVEKNRPKVKF